MIRIKTIIAGVAGLALAAGIALAQGPTPFTQPNLDVIAAQEALEEAMEYLQNARAPNATAVTRAKAYIALAHTELVSAGGVQGLQKGPFMKRSPP